MNALARTPPSLAIRTRPRRSARGSLLTLAWLMVGSAVLWLAAQYTGVQNQLALALTVLAVLLVMQITRLADPLRLLFVTLATFLTLRYLAWRVVETLPPLDTISALPGLLLFAAELYGITLYLLGVFVNVRPVERKVPALPDDPAALPTVDVFVPSYNESAGLLQVTLLAALQMRYPADKLNVYLLDDGGTEQKRNDPDPAKANAARERHESLQALCAELGAHYLTRPRNEHAKAGNINAALPKSDGDLILILDADHVPSADFLENTAGAFLADPKLFLVQTPHFFISPDPLERNLGTWTTMPSENEMFYCVGQKGLDFWNGSFFCGSAALLRRAHLVEAGGIAGESITEDAETALELHARGYRSLYVAKPMIAGLQPETFAGFIGQRTRWAQGMLQILLLKNPLIKRGLRLEQRLAYLSSSFFWLFPLARAAFLITPLFYLFFGLEIYDASLDEFLAYAVAHVVASLMVANRLFGKVRWPFISELYEIAQSLFLSPALLSVLVNPRAPTFKVTSKSETLDKNYVSHLAMPIVVLLGLLLLGVALGVWRYHAYPLEHDNLLIVSGWNAINVIFLLASLGAVYERKQRRQHPRVMRALGAEIEIEGERHAGRITDLSAEGAQLVLDADESLARGFSSPAAVLRTSQPDTEEPLSLNIEVRHAVLEGEQIALGLRFAPASVEERARIVRLVFGSSDAWAAFQNSRHGRRTILGALLFVVWLAFAYGLAALCAILQERLKIDRSAFLRPDAKPLVLRFGSDS